MIKVTFKDVLGVVGATIVDLRWALLTILFGTLVWLKCCHAAEPPPAAAAPPVKDAHPAAPDADPNDPIGVLRAKSGKSVIVIQNGRFLCPAEMHRAIMVRSDFFMLIGCVLIQTDKMHFVFEDGETLDVPTPAERPGVTPGPAPEDPYHGGHAPERNT
jgi:hypothetical protein